MTGGASDLRDLLGSVLMVHRRQVVCYDGTGFGGFQLQTEGVRSIQVSSKCDDGVHVGCAGPVCSLGSVCCGCTRWC